MLARLRLIPQDARFYDMFNRAAENNLEGARLLQDILQNREDVDRKTRRLKDIEHRGDEITHEVFRALHRTFITPLDREDISRLASALDDVLDWIEEAARRLRLYKIGDISDTAVQFGRVLVEQSEQISQATAFLEDRKFPEMERVSQEIHRLENEGDDLLADAVASLYDGVTEVPQLIHAMRWGDVYQLLEDATDKAEEVATVLQNIAFKHA